MHFDHVKDMSTYIACQWQPYPPYSFCYGSTGLFLDSQIQGCKILIAKSIIFLSSHPSAVNHAVLKFKTTANTIIPVWTMIRTSELVVLVSKMAAMNEVFTKVSDLGKTNNKQRNTSWILGCSHFSRVPSCTCNPRHKPIWPCYYQRVSKSN